MVRILFVCALWGLAASSLKGEPVISEFMAQNASGHRDDEGEPSDWIEIHNPTADALQLEGYALTDSKDDLQQWTFPKITLPAGGYLLVHASGNSKKQVPEPFRQDERRRRLLDAGLPEGLIDNLSPEQLDRFLRRLNDQQRRVRLPRRHIQALHTNFKLDGDGEFLALVKPDGKTLCHAFEPEFPKQFDNVSYGLIEGDRNRVGYLLEPSPGRPNGPELAGFVEPVEFSAAAGFYQDSLVLTLASATEGAEIRFSMNGSLPSVGSGTVYQKPLTLTKTTTLRVMASKPGYRSPRVQTRTFFFLDDVVRQSDRESPPDWPGNYVNGQELDYGMSREVVEAHSPEVVKASLRALPTLSIVAPLDSLFDRRRGIYVNADRSGRDWEREASVELIHPTGEDGFQIDGGLRMRGGFSRQGANPKHGFRMIFRKEYGKGKLKYPLFGKEGADEYDKIDFRSSMNYSWAMGHGRGNTLLRDVWSRDTQRDMGQPYTRSRFYHLYLNGHYWGIYMTQERAEASFGATYLGGKKEDYDTVKTHGEVADGTGEARGRLFRATLQGFEDEENYFRVQGLTVDGSPNPEYERLVDIDNIIDYMLITFYTGDKDGPGGVFSKGNNYFSIYNRRNPDGFKFFEHDSEHSLGLGQEDMTGSYIDEGRWRMSERQFNVHWLHTRLAASPHYVERFTERTEQHLYGGGALSPEACLERLAKRERTIDQAIIAHSARWGDAGGWDRSRTREDWKEEVDRIREFMAGRNETLIRQLHYRGWYTGLPAPTFTRSGGPVSEPFQLFAKSGEGVIYATTDGSDPRGPDGNRSSSAVRMEIPQVDRISLLRSPALVRAHVPRDGQLGMAWTSLPFDDSAWMVGRSGVGYDTRMDYRQLIGLDLEEVMHAKNTSVYVRTRFALDDLAIVQDGELTLRMRYDDGFVAYLNGERVVAANAPDLADWQATAINDHPDDEARVFADFSLDHARALLREGENVLAIHGMDGESSSDFLITPEIEIVRYSGAEPLRLPAGRTTVQARSFKDGKWSPATILSFVREP